MSFTSSIQNADKFQLIEIVKDGICYLLVMKAKDAMQAVARFQTSGRLSTKEGVILWQGVGKIPSDLETALASVGFTRPHSA